MNHVRSTLSSSHINHPLLSSPSSYSPSLFSISLSFHSPFKVLFSFRSHYLFSIGLSAMFSFSGSLPRSFTLDSQRTRLFLPLCLFAPSLWLFLKNSKYGSLTLFVYSRPPSSKLLAFSRLFQVSVNPAFYFQISESRASSKGLFPTRHQCHSFRIASSPLELSPPSLAVTTGIDVSFFSSGY